ncbi:MAG: hypothetical protein AAGI15_17485 [Pseudomonadota bacterium]
MTLPAALELSALKEIAQSTVNAVRERLCFILANRWGPTVPSGLWPRRSPEEPVPPFQTPP